MSINGQKKSPAVQGGDLGAVQEYQVMGSGATGPKAQTQGNETMNLPILSTAAKTMSSREIAELNGGSHDNVLKTIRRLIAEGGVFKTTPQESSYIHPQNGQTYCEFLLNFRETMLVISGFNAKVRAKIIDRWIELEQAAAPVAPKPVITLPDFTDPAAAAIAWAAEYQAKQAAMLERDEAIRTKAQIGSRREATAMATAAKATREAEKLRDQLGFNARHATIIQVESKTNRSFSYLPLRQWCKQHGVKAESVPDKRYESVKAWPAAAWLEVYGVDLGQLWGVAA